MLRGMVLTASFSSGEGGRFKISRKVLVMGSLGDSFWALSAMSLDCSTTNGELRRLRA